MRLSDKKLGEFVDDVASYAPAPGGGSVAALSTALGAGLICMVIRISTKKIPDADLQALLPKLEKEKNRLMDLVDEDTAAFNQVMAAFALPKGTAEEKSKRAQAIQNVFKKAAQVPLETLKASLRVLQAGRTVAEKCAPSVASDAGTGIQMAYAGLQGASYNVRINLASIKDESFNSGLATELSDASASGEMEKSYAVVAILSKL